ncbi:heteromeric transposase endonuclease subunit TnsA [Clostridium botulinum]|nr:heteromeric transposase endonuclease subunit TnsA [Clostridium botulinum]
MKSRKSDKGRLKEGRGNGRFQEYKPWIKVHEVPSEGRVHRVYGWKTKRIHQLLSDLECYYFLIMQFSDKVVDIREQYPLLPLEQTIAIAKEHGIKHPAIENKQSKEVVMTTDFVLTLKGKNKNYDIARTIKEKSKLSKKRVCEKFFIEEKYWDIKGVNWGIVTDSEIPKVKGKNLLFLYQDYFWVEDNKLSIKEVDVLTYKFINMLVTNNFNIINTTTKFDIYNNWECGKSLNFFKYLLINKVLITDFSKRINFSTMKVDIAKGGIYFKWTNCL